MANLDELYQAILTGNLKQAKQVAAEAVEENLDPQMVINDYMSAAMHEIGKRFEEGKAFVPELLMSARAMKGALDILKSKMASNTSVGLGKVVIGTVKGDLHDIGKNLVASMLEGCGFEVLNLGVDISAEKFINAVKDNDAQIICMSALLTTTMNYMENVIKALEEEGLREKVKVMVGGAPVSEAFARQIGADGYSSNANAAVTLAKNLISA